MNKFLIALVAAGLSTAAFAQDSVPVDFASVDTDANGGVSYAEAQVIWSDLTQEQFNTADADASGELSPEELATLPPPATEQ